MKNNRKNRALAYIREKNYIRLFGRVKYYQVISNEITEDFDYNTLCECLEKKAIDDIYKKFKLNIEWDGKFKTGFINDMFIHNTQIIVINLKRVVF